MTNDRTILITGVTGNQGGAIAQALQGTGFCLRGLQTNRCAQRSSAKMTVQSSRGVDRT
jgi:hypothetical protein